MIRVTKIMLVVLALGAGLSCLPGRFDDLENQTWVQFVDRDNDQLNGDIGFDVAPIDLPSGTTKGGGFMTSSQTAGGLTQIVFDEKGIVSSRAGFAGVSNQSGKLSPLNDSSIFTVAPYAVSGKITGVVAGQPNFHLVSGTAGQSDAVYTGVAARFDLGPANGQPPFMPNNTEREFGNDIVVGDFGSGTATPDIIVLSATKVTVVNGAGVSRSCGLRRPNFPPSFNLGFKNAALAPVRGNGKNQLVVSGFDLDNIPKILVMETTDIVDGAAACASSASLVTGASTDEPPFALAIGDLDGTTGLDLVTATGTDQASTDAVVKIYKNINFGGAATAETIVAATGEDHSELFGARLLIDDVDNDGKNELVVGDPDGSIANTSGAGKVYIFTYGGCSDGHGPVCLEEALFAPEQGTSNHFGRALAVTNYTTAKGSKKILGVGERNRLNVYFRVNASAADPREL